MKLGYELNKTSAFSAGHGSPNHYMSEADIGLFKSRMALVDSYHEEHGTLNGILSTYSEWWPTWTSTAQRKQLPQDILNRLNAAPYSLKLKKNGGPKIILESAKDKIAERQLLNIELDQGPLPEKKAKRLYNLQKYWRSTEMDYLCEKEKKGIPLTGEEQETLQTHRNYYQRKLDLYSMPSKTAKKYGLDLT